MVCALDRLPEKLGAWCEGCFCHAELLDDETRSPGHSKPFLAKHALNTDSRLGNARTKPFQFCRMRGCRAPELAAGRLWEVEQQMWQSVLSDFWLRLQVPLSVQQRAAITSDFHIGRSKALEVIRSKCQFWELLPWRLCALALPPSRADTARAIAADA
eukprot:1613723-Alexandrium_andersonii.AAC.1